MRPILDVARAYGIRDEELEPYGRTRAKVRIEILDRLADRPNGRYVLTTAVTPTPLGEGKTVHTIGLAQAFDRLGQRTLCTLRQPSMGPIFGVKGGASGGGRARVVPAEDFNIHLTGDIHAVAAANNLLAAFIDTSLCLGNPLRLEPSTITWRRVVDMNDRALRQIVVGLGGKTHGVPRETGFDITAASEVMAILALSDDLFDMRRRLGRIVVGYDTAGEPVTAEGLGCAGAMAAILRDAIHPTLMQTVEGAGCLIHAGPFANIAPGNSSILADRIALKCADYVVTEAGFGADMGAEKFFNIKCRLSGLRPDAVCLVVTIRSLKMHGGRLRTRLGRPLDPRLLEENLEWLEEGLANLRRQMENVEVHGVPIVVAINRFPSDTDPELALVARAAREAGAFDAVVSEVYDRGGEGGLALARALMAACEEPSGFRFLYPLNIPIREKIRILATTLYGARDVAYSASAEKKMEGFTRRGWGRMPICMAKTQFSLSHDPDLKGAPSGYLFPVRDIRAFVGAGFLTPIAGDITLMPGMPAVARGTGIDIDEQGRIIGLG